MGEVTAAAAPAADFEEFAVARVPAAVTYPLRQQVLRPHQRVADLRLPADDDPDTASFAALAGATMLGTAVLGTAVLGTATVAREECPWRPERPDAWRLRGMATAPEARGRGVGARVLAAVLDHVAGHVAGEGGGLLWCHARTPALDFYRRAGFTAHGSVWEEPLIGPHVRMWREVAGRPPAGPAAR